MAKPEKERTGDPRSFSAAEAEMVAAPWRSRRSQRWAKRLMDLLVSVALLVVLCPVIVGVALAVRMTSRGPVLLRQTRLGLNGMPFRMLKFRSMISILPDGSAGYLGEVSKQDARLTPIGACIRAWRLDELPQLLHVLTGTMSLVGPRPDIPHNLATYKPEQHLRFAMPPGCTAWTFTRGAFKNGWSTRQDINVEYVRQWSLWLDVKILFGSVGVLLRQADANPAAMAGPNANEKIEGPVADTKS